MRVIVNNGNSHHKRKEFFVLKGPWLVIENRVGNVPAKIIINWEI